MASGSDLRFHHLHGNNAVITNGGRTALRQNCRSEFNDAIVISNRSVSGCLLCLLWESSMFQDSLTLNTCCWREQPQERVVAHLRC